MPPFPEEVDKRYLLYFMPSALKRIEERTNFVAVKHLSAKELNTIKIPLPPPLEEQCQIAAMLDKIADLLTKRYAQLDKMDLLIKSYFVHMFGGCKTNQKGWEVCRLNEIAEVGSCKHVFAGKSKIVEFLSTAKKIRSIR